METITIESLTNNLKDKGWICPQGIYWNDLVKILNDKNNLNLKIENPLILGGNGASDKNKYDRFMHHLDIADKLNILPIIKNYLDRLNKDVFLYSKELQLGNPLDEIGYWDLYSNDLKKIREISLPAVKILDQIQTINPKIIDEDDLYDLFVQNGFSWNTKVKNEYNVIKDLSLIIKLFFKNELNLKKALKIKKDNYLIRDLLIQLEKIFDEQKSEYEGSTEMESFCYDIFNLKENNK